MKRKLFKLALLCASVFMLPIGAWAASSTDGTPTATLDLQTLVNHAAFQYDGKYLYVHAYGSAASGEEWISVVGGANQYSTVIGDDDATAKYFKTLTSFTGAAASNITRQLAINASSSSTRYIVYRVTNCTGVKVLCNTNNDKRQLTVSAYEVAAGTRAESPSQVGTSAASTTGVESFEISDLTASKIYDIVVNTTATSNIGVGELMFAINKTDIAAWEIDFAGWAAENWNDSHSEYASYTAKTRYTVGGAAAVFYSLSCPNKSSQTVDFNDHFLQARNSNTLVRITGIYGHGLYSGSDDATTYVIRDLAVGDVMYVAAAAAPTMVGTLVGDHFVCADTYEFTYGGKSRSLDYNIYQYFVKTAGDQLFTVPGKTYIYKVGMKKAASIKLNASGYATYSNDCDVEVSGAKAYTAELDLATPKITCYEITSNKVPAGNGVLLYGDAGATVTLSYTTEAAALSNNNLKATTDSEGIRASKTVGHDYYALSGDTFKTLTGDFVHHKAFFEVSTGVVQARSMRIAFAGDITGVANVEAAEAAVKDGKFIENGKLVIVKNGKKFNSAGAQVK